MSPRLGAVKYGSEGGDPFLGRSMGTQADYSHEVAQIIDDEVRKLIEAAHTEAWEVLSENRDVLDVLAGELLEKETLHRAELAVILADVRKRPRITGFDDFGGRVPSDKPPIKTPGELAIERGEEWPKPVPEPAFKSAMREAERKNNGSNGSNGANGTPGPKGPDYGAPAGWHAPGWPPQPGQQPGQQRPGQHQPQQQPPPPGYWYPPPPPAPGPPSGGWGPPPPGYPGGPPSGQHQPYPYQPYPPQGQPAPEGNGPQDSRGDDPSRRNPPANS
jgi:cell division protease FtsH